MQWAEAGDWPSAASRAGLPKLFPQCGPAELAQGEIGRAQSCGQERGESVVLA